MLEKDMERKFVAWCTSRGHKAVKLVPVVGRGFPDRTVIMNNGNVVFLELKLPEGIVSVHQKKWLKSLSQRYQKAFVCRSFEQAIKIIEKFED